MYFTVRVILIISVFLATISLAQETPEILWQQTYGGNANDVCFSVTGTLDGGYALGGYTLSFGARGEDVYMVKVDENGEFEWDARFGGNSDDECRSIVQTADSGYALSGLTESFGQGGSDSYLIKLNEEGEEEWSQTYGGHGTEWAVSLIQTLDGGYAFHGVTTSQRDVNGDYWFVKTDEEGGLSYDLTFGGRNIDLGWSKIFELEESSYAFSGCSFSFGNGDCDFYPIKIVDDFVEDWAINFGGRPSECCRGFSTTDDGGFVGVGPYTLNYQTYDLVANRITADGEELWREIYDFNSTDWPQAVVQTHDGGFAIAGYTSSLANGSDFFLVKLNGEGELQWHEDYGGRRDDYCVEIIETGENEFILAGYTVSFGAGAVDFFLMKVGMEQEPGAVRSELVENPNTFTLYTTYPNPFNNRATLRYSLDKASNINISVYDLSGTKVMGVENRYAQSGNHSISFDCTDLPAGAYIVKLTSLGRTSETKLTLVK